MRDRIVITDIYWHNIYLNLTIQGADLDQYEYYITDLKGSIYPLEVAEGKCVINMVNFPEVKLLKNGKWFFLAKRDGCYHLIHISSACGYKLADLDKIYRYGKEKYAYILSFSVRDSHDVPVQEELPIADLEEEAVGGYQESMICCIHTSYMMLNRRNDRRNILIESKNIRQFCKKAIFIILKRMIDLAYHILGVFRRKDGKHILLMSETRTPIGGNLLALDQRLKERGLDQTYKISYSFSRTLQQSKWKTFLTWSRLLWLVAKQDVIFVDDYVPIFKTIHLTGDTRLVQLWHAGVGFKSVGYSRFGRAGSPHPTDSCHRQYDYAVVGGRGLVDVYEEVFGIPKEHILPYGLARLDGYLDEEKIRNYRDSFYQKYPELQGKKLILFAPTYRGKTQDEAFYPEDWIPQEDVAELCGNEYVFAYKMHPFIKDKVIIDEKYRSCIYDFSEEGDINDLFYVTDILITDFSSNIYEFSLQGKPIIFYAPDKDYYQLTRGVHRTLDEAPGTVCVTFEEVADTIKQENFAVEKLDKFIRESFDTHDEYASDLLIDRLILGHKED